MTKDDKFPSQRTLIIAIFALALCARFFFFYASLPLVPSGDEADYTTLADKLYEKKAFVANVYTPSQFQGGKTDDPTAYRSVVLPAFIAAHYFVFGKNDIIPRISLLIISAFTAVWIFLIGIELFDNKVAIVSGIIWAFYPTALWSWYGSFSLYTESLGQFFLVAAFYYYLKSFKKFSHKDIVFASVMFGFAILTRGYLALTLPLLCLYFLFFAKEKRLLQPFVMGAIVSVIIGLWILRNYEQMGKPVLTTQTDAFYWGNNAWARGSFNGDIFLYPAWESPQVLDIVKRHPNIKNYSEIELSEVWTEEAVRSLVSDPNRIPWLLFRKTATFLLPFQDWQYGIYKYHYLYFVLFIFSFYAFYAVPNKKEFFLILVPFVGSWFAVLLTYGMCRYRFPIEPFVVVTGVFGVFSFYKDFVQKLFIKQ